MWKKIEKYETDRMTKEGKEKQKEIVKLLSKKREDIE